MARYSLFVLKVPLNPKQANKQTPIGDMLLLLHSICLTCLLFWSLWVRPGCWRTLKEEPLGVDGVRLLQARCHSSHATISEHWMQSLIHLCRRRMLGWVCMCVHVCVRVRQVVEWDNSWKWVAEGCWRGTASAAGGSESSAAISQDCQPVWRKYWNWFSSQVKYYARGPNVIYRSYVGGFQNVGSNCSNAPEKMSCWQVYMFKPAWTGRTLCQKIYLM